MYPGIRSKGLAVEISLTQETFLRQAWQTE